ncbi:MAG: hypothetical protein OES24_21985 [Acidimicrobiia bacterium]|nr:hypothetical protein [Acidimicrobiia bacterium]
MRRIAVFLSGLFLAALALPAPAAVAEPALRFAFGERVDFAGVVWLSETETSTTTLEIRVVNADNRSTDSGPMNYKDPGIVLFYRESETDPVTGEVTQTNYEGFSGGAGATFEFDRSLGGAEATFPLKLYGYRCTNPGPVGIVAEAECVEIGEPTVEVHITWTGVGPISRGAFNDKFSDPPWIVGGAHLVQAVREAEATGTVAGDTLQLADGQATFAVLLRGKYHEQMVLPLAR